MPDSKTLSIAHKPLKTLESSVLPTRTPQARHASTPTRSHPPMATLLATPRHLRAARTGI